VRIHHCARLRRARRGAATERRARVEALAAMRREATPAWRSDLAKERRPVDMRKPRRSCTLPETIGGQRCGARGEMSKSADDARTFAGCRTGRHLVARRVRDAGETINAAGSLCEHAPRTTPSTVMTHQNTTAARASGTAQPRSPSPIRTFTVGPGLAPDPPAWSGAIPRPQTMRTTRVGTTSPTPLATRVAGFGKATQRATFPIPPVGIFTLPRRSSAQLLRAL
jgi:hypothetical protein